MSPKKDKKGKKPKPKAGRKPNLLLILTDQQRQPRHWPDDPEWLERLTPADTELARTGVTFSETCAASCMCSPSRASLLTGRWPAEHGVDLTLTRGGFKPDPKNLPDTIRSLVNASRRGEIPARSAASTVLRNAVRRADGGKGEKALDPETPNLATVLARAGYRTVLKGKWHLSQPAGEDWEPEDGDRLRDLYGIEGWVPPDAGENAEPSSFGGGTESGASKQGFDEDFALQAEEFLKDPPPEPWALIVSLVNPHDVIGFPSSFDEGGYDPGEWSDLEEVGLPASADEDMTKKPFVQTLMKVGQGSFLGVLKDDQRVDYCRFYAHLHRLVDTKVGRILECLGDPADPDSLRSKTVIVKTSDHGEMGMAHGGLRQKAFNAYDETINVPMIVSNPVLFPEAAGSAAPASLCDLLPTLAAIAGVDVEGDGIRGRDLTPVLADAADADAGRLEGSPVDLGPIASHPEPKSSVQDEILFTFDDHQAGSAFTHVAPRPNHIRAVRSPEAMYAVYFDLEGNQKPQYELYDMTRDPDQIENLVEKDTGSVVDPGDTDLLLRMRTALQAECVRARTLLPA